MGAEQVSSPSVVQTGDHASFQAGVYHDVQGNQYNYVYHIHSGDPVGIDEKDHPVFQDSWPRSWQAAYDASVSLTRGPCTEGTRVGILKHIYTWATDHSPRSPSVFWLTGPAGSGKSTIAYTVAEHFDRDEKDSVFGASFFCARKFEETRQQNRIIPTIVYHLARTCKPYANALLRLDKFGSAKVLSKQMEDLLVEPWETSAKDRPRTHAFHLVVVDALDEIDGGGGSAFLRDLLKTINGGNLRGLKFLITSRLDPDIAALCSSFGPNAVCRLYEVPMDTVEADIRKYLVAQRPELRDQPQLVKLAQEAGGLFLYAASQIDQWDAAASSISNVPSALDGLYQQILWDAFSDLNEGDFRTCLKILRTLLCTPERVSVTVAAALILEWSNREKMAKVVVNKLHGVLYIKDDQVNWYYPSFPVFVFDQARSKFGIPASSGAASRIIDMSCDEAAHRSLLAQYCFRIMNSGLRFNICNLPSSFLLDSEVPDLRNRVNKDLTLILKYSCQHWCQYLARVDARNMNGSLRKYVDDFLRLPILFWIEVMNLLGSGSQCTTILQKASDWVFQCDGYRPSALVQGLTEATQFAAYFTGSLAAKSTPHLYISSLTTWSPHSNMSRIWKSQFSGTPFFIRTSGHTALLSSIASGGKDGSVSVWDASTASQLVMLNGLSDMKSIAISSDGARIVSGLGDKSVRVWDALTASQLKILSGHSDLVRSVAVSNDGTRISSGSHDNSVRVWDAFKGLELKKLDGHSNHVTCVTFSNDGTRIGSGSDDKTVRVWDASTGSQLKVLVGHSGAVRSVAISNDGTRIVSGSHDKLVLVWDASTGSKLMTLSGHSHFVLSVAISSDGTRIASGSADTSVRVWDASTGSELVTLSGHSYFVNSVAISSGGTRVVSGSGDKSVRVWDASTGLQLMMLTGHTSSVHSVIIFKDGTRIISGSEDRTVRIWDVDVRRDWSCTKENWIVRGPGNQRLMWVSPEIKEELCQPWVPLATVDFTHSKIGTEWANCYTPFVH